jgi:hypothetical protein
METRAGPEKKGGMHVEQHTKPEVRKLLEKYQTEELHLFQAGWQYDNADVDPFIHGTTNSRVVLFRSGSMKQSSAGA